MKTKFNKKDFEEIKKLFKAAADHYSNDLDMLLSKLPAGSDLIVYTGEELKSAPECMKGSRIGFGLVVPLEYVDFDEKLKIKS